MLLYETRQQRPLGRGPFIQRLANHALVAIALLIVSLGIGIAGYMAFERLSFLDAFVDASMLLGGMGPVHPPQTPAGKVFAGLYALYAGLVFIVTAGILFTPVLHRLMHRFHWDENRKP